MKTQLSDEDKILRARLYEIDERIVKKMERIRHSEGWPQKRDKALHLRMLLIKAMSCIDEGQKDELNQTLNELKNEGVNV